MNRVETTMVAVVSMALLATMMTISSPTRALAHGHWNADGDFTLQSESEEMQIRPLTADSSFSAKSAIASSNTEEEQQPVAFEKIQMMPILQQQQQLQQPTLQQEPTMVLNPEICDDDLDNDFDGKVDSRDEECSYITSSTSALPTSGQAELGTAEVTEGEDQEDEQQQSDEDLNEESGGSENSGDEADKEDNDSNDDEQDEDKEDEQQSDDDEDDDDDDEDDDDNDE